MMVKRPSGVGLPGRPVATGMARTAWRPRKRWRRWEPRRTTTIGPKFARVTVGESRSVRTRITERSRPRRRRASAFSSGTRTTRQPSRARLIFGLRSWRPTTLASTGGVQTRLFTAVAYAPTPALETSTCNRTALPARAWSAPRTARRICGRASALGSASSVSHARAGARAERRQSEERSPPVARSGRRREAQPPSRPGEPRRAPRGSRADGVGPRPSPRPQRR